MNELTLWALGAAIAASLLTLCIVYLILLPKRQRGHYQLQHASEQLEQVAEQLQLCQQELKAQTELAGRSRELLQVRQTELRERDAQLSELKQSVLQQKTEQQQQQADYLAIKEQYDRLYSTLEAKEQSFVEQLALLKDSREQLKKEFELLAQEILERKGKVFSDLSQQNIQQLLSPLQSDMKGFRDKMERIHSEELQQRSSLKTELLNLQQLNIRITDQAEQLTKALQGQKKVQGNWGELMLENVLDNSGLRADIDYKREVSFTTADGRRRPDAIIYLPQQKHMVIDAKTSLAAYTRFVNAEDELERQQALAEHCQAVNDRINELADKSYYQLEGLHSPEVVFMFVPIESAYVEALKFDNSLYQRALERNVLVATPTTLLTSLNIVRQLWRFEDQSKHTAELANRAEKFYSKLKLFLDSMQGVGKQLDKAKDSYEKAFGQLYSGRGNLIKQAAEFKELGVAVKSEIDAELVDKARLELHTAVSSTPDHDQAT
ncbi:DNA recombination protein RmuC [Alkalimonas collagenimarina]|uniref:DNA recombination protein RmuC n=1 Tax=Alkalimonas collagenimarina TaxID=400390 RepID=A0ABT9GYH6_9GAMM|nr:DNA recombination protein RmuC [Alkalimonas collagenimarina]MDP4536115.1 DNA recombination protein RmuC [Alkalimonas collagenimarina]